MRTRFLATDYFSVPSTSEALKDFQALYLPAPNFFSPGPVLTVESLLLVPDYSIQHEIDRFPFEEALTDFLSDVIPRFLGAGERRSGHGSTEMLFTPSFERNQEEIRSTGCEMECFERADGSICKEMEVEKRLEVNSGDFNDILPEQSFLLFEIAEVAEFPMWELGISCEENEAMLFFEIPGVSVPLDYIDVEMEISIASPYEVDRLLCIIEDVPDILIFCQESFSAKDGESLQDNKLCFDINLPNFEIGESVLGIHESESMNETFNDLLSSLMPRKNDDELVVNAKDFLGPTNDNFSEHFLTQDISEYGLDHRPLPLNSLLELDLINLNGCILLEKQSIMYPMVSNENSPHIPCSAQLEEVQVLDRTFNVLDIFNSFESVEKEGYFEQMCEEEKGHMETFYESVLNSELSLIDDQFKFLPAPIFSDDKVLKSKFMIMEDIFIALKPHSFSLCDEIYLDWHPLLEGVCNNEACSTFMSMMQEVVSYRIDTSELKSQYEPTMHSDFDFIDDSSADLSIVQHEELTDVHQNCPDEVVLAVDTVVTETVNHDIKESNGAKQIPKNNPAKISSLLESISQSNDLNFFLGVRKGSADISSGFETCNKDRPSIRITSGDAQQELSEASIFSESNIKKIEVHKATLSGYTLSLIEQIEGAYFSNLNKCKHLISNSTSSTTMELLSIPKGRLLKLISEKGGSQCTSGSIDEAFVGLLAIYAIKQLAYYLCFFGIHVAYLYVSICSSKVNNLAGSLQPLQSLLQDAHWKAEKQIIESHPSLSLIEGLLRSNTSKGCKKTLIISNEAFWPSLKHKLTTLKISFSEVGHPCCPSEQLDIMDNCRSQNSILDALSHSDCLLLSYENISASFPFNMFTNILEYGGPRATSRISEIFPSLGSFPCVHFIRFDMENHYLAKTLCEGFEASKNSMISLDGLPRYMDYLQGCLNDQNTEGLLTQFPLDKACNNSRESVWAIDPSLDNDYAMNMQHLSSSNKTAAKPCSVPEVVIIVNTQNLDKNLIISRRSSYQKILELEKRGVQVVERDINLPLDLIFSCAVCLVWYEARNIMNKTGVNMSAIPAFIENIATKILTSLSFAFSGCILIFEGERNFLASIMESSDMLYAAAASLDMNLQLFCSHMPETTDDIILNCIRSVSTKDGGLYSAMPESECIAESFLTKFPSLNPLSAHAILSSGGMLVEFFQWSPERRIQAIGKYKVPAEIISLCNALCRYGELGESKSVMTDCSSVDSDNSSSMLQSKRKKLTYAMSYGTPGMLVDESFYVEPNQMYHNNNMMPQSSQPYHSKNFRFHDVPEKAKFFSNGNILERKHELNSSKSSNIGRDTVVRRSDPHNEFYNDAFDYNCNVLDEPCASMPRSRFNLRRSDLTSEPIVEKFLSSNRLLDGHTCSFPTSTEINRSENDLTDSYEKNGLEKESGEIKTSFFNKELLIKRNNFLRQNHRETPELRNKANRIPYLNESLRSNPSQPSQQQYRQKDIIESIGQANERSRVHPQFSCNTCLSCPGSLKRKAVCQKKSPSIIDRFRYRGGNKQAKGTVNKQKSFTRAQPSRRDLVSKDLALIIPSWTPIDKRARQHLSFVRTGNEQQSRLAWRRSDSPRVLCSSRKRQRNDV